MTDFEKIRAGIEKEINKLREEYVGEEYSSDEQLKDFAVSQLKEEGLKAVFEYAPDAYYLYNLSGKFVDGNLMAEEISGYQRDELIGRSFMNLKILSSPDIIKAAKLLFLNIMGRATGPDNFTFIRKDGSKIELEIRTYPVKIEGKKLVLGIARDVSERNRIQQQIKELNRTLDEKVVKRTEELKVANEELHKDIIERLHAEEALHQSEERFRHIINNAGDIIYNTDRKGNLTYYNPTTARIMNYTEKELQKKNYMDMIRPDYRKEVKKFYTKQLTEKTLNTYLEFPAIRGDGSTIWLGQNVQPILKKGKVKGFQAVARDISDRKKTEKKLRESERRYRAIFENSRDVIYITDKEGFFVDINNSGLELFGYTWKELSKIKSSDLYVNPDKRKKFLAELETHGFVRDYELKLKNKNGDHLDCLISSTISPAADGKVMNIQGIIRDITQQKKSQRALLETEKRFRELLENLKMIAVLLDLDGKILFCNDFLLDLTDYKRDEILGADWFDNFVPEENRNKMKKLFFDSAKEGKIPSHDESNIITRSGEERLIFWNNTALRDTSGNIFGTASIGSDMTDRYKAEEQLRHAQRMEVIGKLAGGIAHDFNNALTPILALSQMHLAKIEDDHPVKRALSTINKSAKRATKLTARLMAFGRKQVLETHIININTTLISIGDLLKRSVGDSVMLKMKPSSNLWNVKADPIQIEQVLLNLAINAKDALNEKGEVVIRTRNITINKKKSNVPAAIAPGDYVLTTVSDNGPGIEKEIKEHIFEPFFTTKAKGQGTGLGLSVVYGIVKQHQGEIICNSSNGNGTTFEIYLPRVDEPVEEIKHEAIYKDYRGDEVIMLVEDDTEVREVLGEILKDLGYIIIEAADDTIAQKLSKKFTGQIHLLLTDLILPGINGRELSEVLVKTRKDMKILFISGYSDDVIAKHGVIDKGLSFLQKPFTASSLGKKIRDVLES